MHTSSLAAVAAATLLLVSGAIALPQQQGGTSETLSLPTPQNIEAEDCEFPKEGNPNLDWTIDNMFVAPPIPTSNTNDETIVNDTLAYPATFEGNAVGRTFGGDKPSCTRLATTKFLTYILTTGTYTTAPAPLTNGTRYAFTYTTTGSTSTPQTMGLLVDGEFVWSTRLQRFGGPGGVVEFSLKRNAEVRFLFGNGRSSTDPTSGNIGLFELDD